MSQIVECSLCRRPNVLQRDNFDHFYCGFCNAYQPKKQILPPPHQPIQYQTPSTHVVQQNITKVRTNLVQYIDSKLGELSKQTADLQVKQQQQQQQKQALCSLKKELKNKDTAIQGFKSDAFHQKNLIQQQQQQIKELQQKLSSVTNKNRELVETNNTLTQDSAKKSKEIQKLVDRNDDVEDMVSSLRELLNEKDIHQKKQQQKHDEDILNACAAQNKRNIEQIRELQHENKSQEVQLLCMVSQFRLIREALQDLGKVCKTDLNLELEGPQVNQLQSVVKVVKEITTGIKFLFQTFPIQSITQLETFGFSFDNIKGPLHSIIQFVCNIFGHHQRLKIRVKALHKIGEKSTSYSEAVTNTEVRVHFKNQKNDIFLKMADEIAVQLETTLSVLDASIVQYNHMNSRLACAMYHKVLQLMLAVMKLNMNDDRIMLNFQKSDHEMMERFIKTLEFYSMLDKNAIFHFFISSGANAIRFKECVFASLVDPMYSSDFHRKIQELYAMCFNKLLLNLEQTKNDHRKDILQVASKLTVRNEHIFLERDAKAIYEADITNDSSTFMCIMEENTKEKINEINQVLKQMSQELNDTIDSIKLN